MVNTNFLSCTVHLLFYPDKIWYSSQASKSFLPIRSINSYYYRYCIPGSYCSCSVINFFDYWHTCFWQIFLRLYLSSWNNNWHFWFNYIPHPSCHQNSFIQKRQILNSSISCNLSLSWQFFYPLFWPSCHIWALTNPVVISGSQLFRRSVCTYPKCSIHRDVYRPHLFHSNSRLRFYYSEILVS